MKFLETLALVPIEELQLKGCNWDVEAENHVDLCPIRVPICQAADPTNGW